MPRFGSGSPQVTHISKMGRKVTQTYHTRAAALASVKALRKLGVRTSIGVFSRSVDGKVGKMSRKSLKNSGFKRLMGMNGRNYA